MQGESKLWKARDLPERLGPVATKELRQGLRRGIFLVPFILVQLLAIIAVAAEFQMEPEEVEVSTPYAGPMNLLLFFPGDMFSGPFWMVAGLVCIFVMPLGGLMLMSQELEEGNHELLLMTPLSRWQVVWGKFGALWGLCLLTFSSLLPYMIVRYFMGGLDVARNFNLALTVVLGSAIICAGAIGASAFRSIGKRVLVFSLFLGSLAASVASALFGSGLREEGVGFFFHLNAYSVSACYILFGLATARACIRLVVHQYEVDPSWLVMGLLLFAPFAIGLSAAMTLGYGSFVGSIGFALIVWFIDITPKAPNRVSAPIPNIPKPPALPK